MNELIQTLIECLNQEAGYYRKLAIVADQQKEMLIAGKVEALPENVRLEEKEVFALGPLVARRNEILNQIAKLHQVKTMTLSDVLEKSPIEMIEELKKAVIELVRAAKKLEEINGSNELLLQNALSYVNFTLKVLASGGQKKSFSPMVSEVESKPTYVNRVV
jgi:flagellar biosynthesis/type III secretory pathway chaperone